MWYWKPEQPPPTTATRNAVGAGLCCAIISRTLVDATGVTEIISRRLLAKMAACRNPASLLYQNAQTPNAAKGPFVPFLWMRARKLEIQPRRMTASQRCDTFRAQTNGHSDFP